MNIEHYIHTEFSRPCVAATRISQIYAKSQEKENKKNGNCRIYNSVLL